MEYYESSMGACSYWFVQRQKGHLCLARPCYILWQIVFAVSVHAAAWNVTPAVHALQPCRGKEDTNMHPKNTNMNITLIA